MALPIDFPLHFFFMILFPNTQIKQVLQMEASILGCLKFEMTAPTAKCFLR